MTLPGLNMTYADTFADVEMELLGLDDRFQKVTAYCYYNFAL